MKELIKNINKNNSQTLSIIHSYYSNSPNFSEAALNILLEKTSQWLAQDQCFIIFLESSQYPQLLKEIHRPPEILYLQGNIKILEEPKIAVVGSRQMSDYGKDNAWAFSKFLAESGLTITSGLALGIDGVAHEAALSAGGYTIAVLPTGIDQCYPRSHASLLNKIISSGQGLVISEFPLGTPPLKTGFPRRNRIISGLSMGVLVVEAALKSGSLITARTAMEQGREVFAIPGSIHHALSKGCHELIKTGAKCVESGSDILEECRPFLGGHLGKDIYRAHKITTQMTQLNLLEAHGTPGEVMDESVTGLAADQDYRALLEIMGPEISRIDDLIQAVNRPAREVASMLLMLELDGWLEQVNGGYKRVKNFRNN